MCVYVFRISIGACPCIFVSITFLSQLIKKIQCFLQTKTAFIPTRDSQTRDPFSKEFIGDHLYVRYSNMRHLLPLV